MGVIECLSAGYRFLGRRAELLVIPIAIDLLLWFAPQFSVAPLTAQMAIWYEGMGAVAGSSPDMVQMSRQMADSLRELGQGFNLLSALVSSGLMHVPSLMATGVGSASARVLEVSSVSEAVVLWLVFSILGLLIGVIYLGLLARSLPIGRQANIPAGLFAGNVLRQWIRVLAFVLLVALALTAVYLPISFGIGLFMLVSPGLGSAMAVASGALILIVFFYMYFTTSGIVMDNLPVTAAMMRSVRLVRENFWSTLGFFAVSTLISLGITLVLVQLAVFALWARLFAIVLNAYVGTGLAMALLVFYRTRQLRRETELAG
ncbi:MAG: hypothetical protein H3C34_01390 [Caldilineaceae bacterium]|nr:hypothetical protein [Caldilineaceae bacterium]